MESGYAYEATYTDMMQKIEKEIVGGVPKGINSKKTPNPIWKK
jgi:hypothetical protein